MLLLIVNGFCFHLLTKLQKCKHNTIPFGTSKNLPNATVKIEPIFCSAADFFFLEITKTKKKKMKKEIAITTTKIMSLLHWTFYFYYKLTFTHSLKTSNFHCLTFSEPCHTESVQFYINLSNFHFNGCFLFFLQQSFRWLIFVVMLFILDMLKGHQMQLLISISSHFLFIEFLLWLFQMKQNNWIAIVIED